jgi:predicted lipoprotein with Yx(FWY)xxD motif
MVACNDTPGGLALPDDTHGAGRAGAGANGGSGGTDAAGEAGQGNTEVAGSSNAGTGGITNATGGSGGSHSHSTGGTKSGSGGSGDTGGTTSETAGESGAGPEAGGAGDEAGAGGEAGSVDPGAAGTGSSGMAGGGGSGNVPAPLCIFSSDPFVGMDADGGAPPPGGLLVGTNAFVGPYLTDLAGLTLYIYGADFPGDCNYAPISNCYGDCAQAWMPFDAHDRSLPATLDPANFGDLDRGDGTHQTTYLGWPLYYYKSDTAPNMINGQGKGKTWFAAETVLPNLMIMRGPTAAGGIKFLGDQGGHTLYSLPGDTLGTSSASPVSNCTGDCAAAFTPFYPGDVFPVTTLEPHDVSLFQRADGKLQVAYKGAPLYSNNSDVRSGDELGVGVNGAALVLP